MRKFIISILNRIAKHLAGKGLKLRPLRALYNYMTRKLTSESDRIVEINGYKLKVITDKHGLDGTTGTLVATGKYEPLTTKVTRIGNFYHCRLFREGKLHDEVACNLKEDIGYCMYWMLRWYDKMCFEPFSNMATAARYRSRKSVPKGKVKYHISLKSSD